MKYVAIQFSGISQVNGLQVVVDDTDFPKPGEVLTISDETDTSVFGRAVFHYLKRHGWKEESDGRIKVVAYGVVLIEQLVGLYTLAKYIDFDKGIRFPYGLTEGSAKIEDIIDYIRGQQTKAITDKLEFTGEVKVINPKTDNPKEVKKNAISKVAKPRRKASPKSTSD